MLHFTALTSFITTVLHVSILALIYALSILDEILRKDKGTPEMMKIADSITEGSEGYFKAQYSTIINLSLVFAFLIFSLYWYKGGNELEREEIPVGGFAIGLFEALSFLFGALCSGFAGYAGMWVSIKANSRVANAARSCYN